MTRPNAKVKPRNVVTIGCSRKEALNPPDCGSLPRTRSSRPSTPEPCRVMPPSTTRFWPVTKRARSEQRKTTTSAMSSGIADASERRLGLHVRHRPVETGEEDVGEAGVDHPGRDRVDPDARAVLERGGGGEGHDRRLGGCVGRLARGRSSPADRRGAHDGAAAGLQDERDAGLHAVEDPGEVERDDPRPLGGIPVHGSSTCCSHRRC